MKHRPTIYIGIGEVGCRTLVQIKKQFVDEFGEGNIPSYIRFVGLDCEEFQDEEILDKFLYISSGVISPKQYYIKISKEGEQYHWYPNDMKFLPDSDCGAGSNRANARLLFEINLQEYMSEIRDAINGIANAGRWDVGIHSVDVRFVMSLSEGSGSGILIPLALMVSQYKNVSLYAYSVLNGIKTHFNRYQRDIDQAFMNSYSTTLELDYIQHASAEHPVEMRICDDHFTITEPLFQEFYMVESRDDMQMIVTEIGDVEKMLSLSMYSASFDGVWSHVFKESIKNGRFNIRNKIGWLGSLGGCEVVYQGDMLVQMHSCIEAQKTVETLLDDKYNFISVADYLRFIGILDDDQDTWFHLKERLGLHLFVNSVEFSFKSKKLSHISEQIKSAKKPFELNVNLITDDMIKDYIKLHAFNLFQVDSFLEELYRYVSGDFLNKISEHKREINDQLEVSLNEVDRLYDSLTKRSVIKAVFDTILENNSLHTELESQVKKVIFLQQEKSLIEILYNQISLLSIYVSNHKAVYATFREKLETVKVLLNDQVKVLNAKLERAKTPVSFDITNLLWESLNTTTFRSEISVTYVFDMDLKHVSAENIKDAILNWTAESFVNVRYRDMSIVSVIESLPEEKRNVVLQYLNTSANKSLTAHRRGAYCGNDTIQTGILTMYSENYYSCLEKDLYRVLGPNTTLYTNKTNNPKLKNKIVFTYLTGFTLPLFIEVFTSDRVKRSYKDAISVMGYNPHIDTGLYKDINESAHSLWPEEVEEVASVGVNEKPKILQEQKFDVKPESQPASVQSTLEKEDKKYDVFISSKSEDYVYAEQIFDFLTHNGLNVFLASRELMRIAEAEYAEAIDEALDDSKHMIVMLSKHDYAKSKWVLHEWRTFANDKKSRFRDGNLLVVKFPEVEQKKLPAGLRYQEFFLFESFRDKLLYYVKK